MLLTENRTTKNISKKLGFGFQKTGWIGIDIGSTSIKIAQVKKQHEGWELLNHLILPIRTIPPEDDASSEKSFHPMDSIIETLKKHPLLFSLFNGRKAAAVLPLSVARLQSVSVPEGSPEELRMMIQQDLQSQPGEEETDKTSTQQEFVFWKENLDTYASASMVQASVVSAPQTEILRVAKCLLACSVHCHLVSVQPIAIANAIQLHQSDQIQAGFEWGTESALFTIVQNGQPLFSRIFRNCGFSNITRLLQNRMGLTFLESLQLLKTFQSPGYPEGMQTVEKAITEMIAMPMKKLAHEFTKTLEFIKQKRPDLNPQKIWILGTGAGLCQIETQLLRMTNIKSKLWTLPTQNEQPTESSRQLQAKLGTAIAISALAYHS